MNDLNEQAKLQKQIDRDMEIIRNEDTFSSEKNTAEGRVAGRTEELAPLQTQISEREIVRGLKKKIWCDGDSNLSCGWCNDWCCHWCH